MRRFAALIVLLIVPACDQTAEVSQATSTTQVMAPGAAASSGDATTTTSVVASSTTVAPPVERWERLPDAPLAPGLADSAVWTGSSLVVWAALRDAPADGPVAAGATYDPAARSWTKLPAAPRRLQGTAVVHWTGSEVLVWGGGFPEESNEGAAWSPATKTWRAIPPAPIESRAVAQSAWTGKELIVWGGSAGSGNRALADGAAYEPVSGTWRPIAQAPLEGRHGAATAWTGTEVVIWGGKPTGRAELADGAAYNPDTDTWRALPAGPLSGRGRLRGVWTGQEVALIAGAEELGVGGGFLADGAAFNPVTNRWRKLRDPTGPAGARYESGEVWTGREVLVSGHIGETTRWVAYDPSTDSWRPLPPAPPIRSFAHNAVWTGTEMLAWGPTIDCLYSDCTSQPNGQAFISYRP